MAWFMLIAQALAAMSPAACAEALGAVPSARACAASQVGLALANTQAEAERLIADAKVGETRFAATFGRSPSRYPIHAFSDPTAIAPGQAALRRLGIVAVLPVPAAQFVAQQRARAAAAVAMVRGGTMVVRNPASSDEPRNLDDRDHIPHELAHLWYGELFWTDVARPPRDRYGSAAPDWLDEAAAILMESDTRAATHRNRFSDGRDPDRERAAAIPPEIPLADLMTMPHPVSDRLPAPGGAPGPIRLTSAPSLFYAEIRVLADYLIERSGDRRIFAAISDGMRQGGSFAEWLARDGARHRLPATLAGLDADWQRWLLEHYGPPA
ncbi:hypothetical protein [Sphingomonas sp.]|jgi:hypothetical protein|uniref:hypothetical protein n=1 Tax=Sphingomonas sp. TaxID=28214 RepID=UPI002D809F51|nr:hypothetical protein [Sphingomonas sp.]HEU0045909.1 hypothetical protein [Sphingomonas sp.]